MATSNTDCPCELVADVSAPTPNSVLTTSASPNAAATSSGALSASPRFLSVQIRSSFPSTRLHAASECPARMHASKIFSESSRPDAMGSRPTGPMIPNDAKALDRAATIS
eukprot:3027374-Rhodomonas_salina.1